MITKIALSHLPDGVSFKSSLTDKLYKTEEEAIKSEDDYIKYHFDTLRKTANIKKAYRRQLIMSMS